MNKLDDLLKRINSEPELWDEFLAELMNAQLYMICKVDEATKTTQIMPWADETGHAYIPVFTTLKDMDEALEGQGLSEGESHQEITGSEFFNIMAEMYEKGLMKHLGADPDIAINVVSEHAFLFRPQDVMDVLAYFGHSHIVTEEDTEVQLGLPEHYPVELKLAISKILEKENIVKTAYLGAMMRGDELSMLVGLNLEDAERRDDIFTRCGVAGRPHLPEGTFLDMTLIAALGSDELSDFLVEEGDCFYKKP